MDGCDLEPIALNEPAVSEKRIATKHGSRFGGI